MKTTTYKKLLLLAALPALMLASCSKEEMTGDRGNVPGANGNGIRFHVAFAAHDGGAGDTPQTRVATSADERFAGSWEDGDEIGIFAVAHGTELAAPAATPTAPGNYIHNAKLTYSSAGGGKWTAAEPLYWPQDGTALDFYAYHPYDPGATNPRAIAFSVKPDQSGADADGRSHFSLSQLMTAEGDYNQTTGYSDDDGDVTFYFAQALALIEVKVMGSSLPAGYGADDLRVLLDGCYTDCILQLHTPSQDMPPPTLAPTTITMYPCPHDGATPGIYAYRALVPEQTVSHTNFRFSFHYGSSLLHYNPFTARHSLEQGKVYRFDVSFPASLATVSDDVRLADLFTAAELAEMTGLRVHGKMTEADFATIRNDMPALTSLHLGAATVEGNALPAEALSGKSGLQEFVFPAEITEIGNFAFDECSNLKGSLTIPEGVETIGVYAFYGCSNLTGPLTIPRGVKTIGNGAFHSCSGFDGLLTISEDVETIGESAFYGCSNLKGPLTIPRSVTTIGNRAFFGCSGFDGELKIPEGIETIGDATFSGCSNLTGPLTIPTSVTMIGWSAFFDCSGFNGELTIPEGVETIGGGAFEGCSGLIGPLMIPGSVTTIGNRAFLGCSGFTGELTIPGGITTIGVDAFNGCSKLTGELTIPEGVETIGDRAFNGCSGFTGPLTIPGRVTEIGREAFAGCSGFNDALTIPRGVTEIGSEAFAGCSKLLSITCHIEQPDRVNFGGNIFSGVSGSIPVYVPAGTKSTYEGIPVWYGFKNIQPIQP